MQFEPVIGLEIHVQLLTKSKLFSGSATTFGADPNTQASNIDLALPGVLPVLNKAVLDMAIKFALGINATINQYSVFARKNYFYPDLPKGYQISQHDLPIISNGSITIPLTNNTTKNINIVRAHLEEDAGKSIHDLFDTFSAIDLNRAGNPLLEIVSAPELSSAQEAVAYLKAIHHLICHLQICDGNMQEGSFRCDANVSIRPIGSQALGTRTEIKNVNSFRFIERAINYEIARQTQILTSGGVVNQETRLYDPNNDETRPMRNKEEANDYRYFPEPDLPPIIISDTMIQQIKQTMPELPKDKLARFITQYGLNDYDANLITSDSNIANYFEQAAINLSLPATKLLANWLLGDLLATLNKTGIKITACPIPPATLTTLIQRIADNTISGKIAKNLFEQLWHNPGNVDDLIKASGMLQITDKNTIATMIDTILAAHAEKLQEYLSGKDKLFGYFVGLIMQASHGKINPQLLNTILQEKLHELKNAQ